MYDNISLITGVTLLLPAGAAVPLPAVAAPVSILTPAKIPTTSFHVSLNNELFYRDMMNLESPQNIQSKNTTIPLKKNTSC